MSTLGYASMMKEADMDDTPLMYLDKYRTHLNESDIAYYKPIRSGKLKVSTRSVLPFEALFSKEDPLGSKDSDAGQGEHQPAGFPFGDAAIFFL